MVAFLSTSILEYFAPIFAFLLVTLILYAVLNSTNILGDNSRLNFIIALAAGVLTLFSNSAIGLVNYMTPWIVFVLFFIVMLFMIYSYFGLGDKEKWEMVAGPKAVYTVFIVLLIFGIKKVVGPFIPNEGGGDAFAQILFSPRILGVIVILLVAMWAVQQLSGMDLRPKW